LKALRVGVTRAREELAALLGVDVEEMAGAKAAGGDGKVDARVVVGTEAALHRVDRADAVVFLDFDQHLLAPRATAAEEALALLARAGRLVGGRLGVGRVLVQTRLPDHEVLVAAVHADPSPLAESEREVRRSLGLPPFSAQASLSGPGAGDYAHRLAAQEIADLRVAALGGGQWLVSAPDHQILCDSLAATPRPADRLRVAVDPSDV
jgi:primosomal protein N' (replication factor Y)